MEWLFLALAIALTFGTAVFVAAEFSFITVKRATIEQEAAAGDKRSIRLLSTLQSLSTQLSLAQIGITVTTLIVGYLVEPSLAKLLESPLISAGVSEGAVHAVAGGAALVIAAAAQMIFGELVPKNLAIARPSQIAKAVNPTMTVLLKVFSFAVHFLNGSANAILHALKVEPQEELRSARSAEEIRLVVERSGSEGTLEARTADLITRTLEFGDRTADDVMTPRRQVQSILATAPVQEVLSAVRVKGHSRFPVIGEDREDIIGIVHVKNAVAVPVEERNMRTVADVMVEPLLVPGSAQLDPLLTTLRDKGFQMAVVIDEYGSSEGIVTLEDLVEELVGDITDEFDRPGAHARKRRDGSWSVAASLRPDELGDLTKIELPEDDDYDTIGGLVFDRLGQLPENGDSVIVVAKVGEAEEKRTILLTVDRMDGLRIDRVSVVVGDVVQEEEEEQ